jgi:hypothetical protein
LKKGLKKDLKSDMTSPSPLLYDTYYHIYNRGVNRENIFVEERNYDLFLRLFERHLIPVADLFAYCLLKNHFHLSVRIKSEEEILATRKTLTPMRGQVVSTANDYQPSQDNPTNGVEGQSRKPLGSHYVSDQFSNFFNAYAKTINKAYGRTGSLFQHPFGRVPITCDRQFWNVIAYIHQNPQKHGFVKDFRNWTPSRPPPNPTVKIWNLHSHFSLSDLGEVSEGRRGSKMVWNQGGLLITS